MRAPNVTAMPPTPIVDQPALARVDSCTDFHPEISNATADVLCVPLGSFVSVESEASGASYPAQRVPPNMPILDLGAIPGGRTVAGIAAFVLIIAGLYVAAAADGSDPPEQSTDLLVLDDDQGEGGDEEGDDGDEQGEDEQDVRVEDDQGKQEQNDDQGEDERRRCPRRSRRGRGRSRRE